MHIPVRCINNCVDSGTAFSKAWGKEAWAAECFTAQLLSREFHDCMLTQHASLCFAPQVDLLAADTMPITWLRIFYPSHVTISATWPASLLCLHAQLKPCNQLVGLTCLMPHVLWYPALALRPWSCRASLV